VEESVPQRTLMAAAAAKADVMAGFTAERDMGTEGAGCADVAVRDAINSGLIPGPRMRVSCNAIDILGGHEDAIGFNPAQKVLSNADYANTADQIIAVMRAQRKGGADFTKWGCIARANRERVMRRRLVWRASITPITCHLRR
jgi:imidazolonepropionase-like amidohydrolase